jgi:PAS domain S-box-containing protein
MAAAPHSVIDLRKAIERHEVVPYFQPIVKLRSGGLWGFEVLARWNHPERGVIPPDQFTHLAESAGLAEPLFEAILDQALVTLSGSSDGLTLSVNISPLQLRNRSLPVVVRSIAERNRFPLEQLLIEITETAMVDNMQSAQAIAAELKAMGVRLGLDDFGTGYSSLYHLNSFPLDVLKIDQSFVRDMNDRRESRKIVATIIGLSQSLGLTIVAEGIEDKAHADILFYLGAELGQGWLFGRAVSAGKVHAMIAKKVLASPSWTPLTATDMAFHVEAAPAQRLAFFNALFQGAPVGLFFLDRNFRYLNHNKRLTEISGAALGSRVGATMKEVAPAIFAQIELYLQRALMGEAIDGVKIRTPRPGFPSESNTMLLSLTPARDEADEIVGISAAAMDITELTQVLEALRVTEDHYQCTLELSGNIPYTADAEGKILWIGALSRSGLSSEELTANWRSIIHPDDLPLVEEVRTAARLAGKPFDIEFRFRAKDGTWMWVCNHARPRRAENGEIIGWYGLVEDIDERKRAGEERLDVSHGGHATDGEIIPRAAVSQGRPTTRAEQESTWPAGPAST